MIGYMEIRNPTQEQIAALREGDMIETDMGAILPVLRVDPNKVVCAFLRAHCHNLYVWSHSITAIFVKDRPKVIDVDIHIFKSHDEYIALLPGQSVALDNDEWKRVARINPADYVRKDTGEPITEGVGYGN